MAVARLHVICGNCGDERYMRYSVDGADVTIACGNCATLHTLADTVMEKSVDSN